VSMLQPRCKSPPVRRAWCPHAADAMEGAAGQDAAGRRARARARAGETLLKAIDAELAGEGGLTPEVGDGGGGGGDDATAGGGARGRDAPQQRRPGGRGHVRPGAAARGKGKAGRFSAGDYKLTKCAPSGRPRTGCRVCAHRAREGSARAGRGRARRAPAAHAERTGLVARLAAASARLCDRETDAQR